MPKKNPDVCLQRKTLKATERKSHCNNGMEWCAGKAEPLVYHRPLGLALLHMWVWGPESVRGTELKPPTLWRKNLSVGAMRKILLTVKLKKMQSLAPLVLINSSFKRTSIFRFRVLDWFSNLHNRVKHLCTRVFCLYMCYVLMGQESLFHLANYDNYDAELIGKIFKMIIRLRFKRTL